MTCRQCPHKSLFMLRHQLRSHPEEDPFSPEFGWEIISKEPTCIQRQVKEALLIKESRDKEDIQRMTIIKSYKPEPEPKSRIEPKSKSEPKPGPGSESEPEPKSEPNLEPKPKPKPELGTSHKNPNHIQMIILGKNVKSKPSPNHLLSHTS